MSISSRKAPPSLVMSSTNSSSGNVSVTPTSVSRQASWRSTASVQAVPIRKVRKSPAGGGYSRQTAPHIAALTGLDTTPTDAYFANLEEPPEPGRRENTPGPWHTGNGMALEPAARAISVVKQAVKADAEGSGTPDLRKPKAVSDFDFLDILGEGSYSTVMLARDKTASPPHDYAVKILDKEHIRREKKTKYALSERDTMKLLAPHPGIVRLYWTFQDAHNLYYVQEVVSNGELLSWILKYGSFDVPSAQFYAAQILSAIAYMHSKNVIHRDLKPENILLSADMRIKVSDFGSAKILSTEPAVETDAAATRSRSFVGTPEYVSPEVLSDKRESSKASDLWAFGCILYHVLSGRPPFKAATEYLLFQKILHVDYEFPALFPSSARDLVEKLLILDSTQRLAIDAIMQHPFFAGVDFDSLWTATPPPIHTGIIPPQTRKEVSDEDIELFNQLLSKGVANGSSLSDSSDALSPRNSTETPWLQTLVDTQPEAPPAPLPPVSPAPSPRHPAKTRSTIFVRPHPTKSRSNDNVDSDPWKAIFQANEKVVLQAPVVFRQSLIASKKRILILTDLPRIICVKEAPHKVSLKMDFAFRPSRRRSENLGLAETLANPHSVPSSAPSTPAAGTTATFDPAFAQAANRHVSVTNTPVIRGRIIRASAPNDKTLVLYTTTRTFKFEQLAGVASRWQSLIHDTLNGL